MVAFIKLAWAWATGNLRTILICAGLVGLAFVAGFWRGCVYKAATMTATATSEAIDTKGKQDEVGNNRPDPLPLAGVLHRGDL